VLKPLTKEKSEFWEGCLSVPGLRGKVSRPNRLSVQAWNEKKEKVDFIAEGFAATVIQHECDHLHGKLYVDRMEDLTSLSFTKEMSRYHSDTEEDSEE
jgi:peptide deformylase